MDRAIEVRKAFTDFTEEYDKFMLDTKHTQAKIKILEIIKDEIYGHILDVATGTGDVAIWILKNTSATQIDGVDFSEKMIKKAKEKAIKEKLNINFLVQDVENLNIQLRVLIQLSVVWVFAGLQTERRHYLK